MTRQRGDGGMTAVAEIAKSVPLPTPDAVEKALIGGDLAKLSEDQRLAYYNSLCQSLGLNPLTQPFQYITLNGKLKLYATKDATEQLRKVHGVSIERLDKERQDDLYVVTAYARDAKGRTDASTGALTLNGLKGEALANAIMKCETKAKRRVTLSICGLGMLDEIEIETIQPAQSATVATLPAPQPEGFDSWLLDLEAVADNGLEPLKKAWSLSPLEMRNYMLGTNRDQWEAIKARAGKVQVLPLEEEARA